MEIIHDGNTKIVIDTSYIKAPDEVAEILKKAGISVTKTTKEEVSNAG